MKRFRVFRAPLQRLLSNKSKDKEPDKRDRKFSVRPNLPERITIGFQDQMSLLIGSYGWSCYVFEDEETCKAFVRKSALIEKIVDSINIYTLREVLASKDIDTLKLVDQIFEKPMTTSEEM
ncbi:hypothetical protein [Photobacterium leiognathi]|uniref:hypothetical protein n=1 Tax=Photobacterium leiognathi TaxID=553611 RepID=UPI00273855CF|nr:hypothetical protein [Photobacterium leiognathi]